MSTHPIKYKNSTGASMPAFGIFKLESATRQSGGELNPHAELVAADGNEALYVNSALAVADTSYGNCRSCNQSPLWIRYNTSNAPADGDVVGPVSGQTYVDGTGTGLVVIYKDTAKELVLCEKLGSGVTVRTNPSSFTIVELDPSTGDVIAYMDRGRSRAGSTTQGLGDVHLLYSSDGFLYAVGNGWINKDNGCLVKWNVDTYEAVWYSSEGAFTSPGTRMSTAGAITGAIGNSGSGNANKLQSNLCEASDGAIWVAGGTNSWFGSFNPSTGAQIAAVNHTTDAVYPADNAGGVVVLDSAATGGKYLRVYDASGAETASWTTFLPSLFEVVGSIIVVGSTSTLKVLNADDLTEITTRSVPAGESYLAAITDGTTVWTATSHATTPKYRAYDATNLATETWNATRDTTSNGSFQLRYANSALYDFAEHTRKINATTGAEIWEFTGANTVPNQPHLKTAVSSSLVFSGSAATTVQLYAVNESTGEPVWTEGFTDNSFRTVLPTSDGRLFVCCARVAS